MTAFSFPVAAEERYRRLFLLLREPVIVGDPVRVGDAVVDWVIRDVNAAVFHQLAMTRDQMLGRRLTEVLEPAVAAEHLAITQEVLATGSPRRFEAHLAATGRWYLTTVLRLDEQTVVSAATDITELKRSEAALRASEQALQRANERLRDTDRRKDEFLGMLSHELRNPLAPMRTSMYVLDRSEPGSPQARRAREVMARQVHHLSRLVDDLLEVTRIARGKIQLHVARVDLCELVRRTADDHRALLQDRALAFTLEVPDEPVWVEADATRLAQIIGNLLQNAAKFTPPGGAVKLALARAGDAIEIRVRDTGVGIEPEFLEHVFEPFTQSEQTLARSKGGLGLGLALVKALAELHGGSASVVSHGRDQGAEFVIRLGDAAAPTPDAPPSARDAAPARRRVLVVDDNLDAAHSLAELVSLFGHSVEVAFDGPAALAKAREQMPDVILCDIGLPGMSGYDVARQIRMDPGLDRIRLVAVSGYAQPDDRKRATDAGFAEHVAKPPDPARLEALLR